MSACIHMHIPGIIHNMASYSSLYINEIKVFQGLEMLFQVWGQMSHLLFWFTSSSH